MVAGQRCRGLEPRLPGWPDMVPDSKRNPPLSRGEPSRTASEVGNGGPACPVGRNLACPELRRRERTGRSGAAPSAAFARSGVCRPTHAGAASRPPASRPACDQFGSLVSESVCKAPRDARDRAWCSAVPRPAGRKPPDPRKRGTPNRGFQPGSQYNSKNESRPRWTRYLAASFLIDSGRPMEIQSSTLPR